MDDTIAHGVHSIHAAQAEAAVQVILHHVVTEDATTNAMHDSARWLLVRMFIFWAEKILNGHIIPLFCNYFKLILFFFHRCSCRNQPLS
jgi:hypothetical protein